MKKHRIVGTELIPDGWTESTGLEMEVRGNYPSGMGMQKNKGSLSARGRGLERRCLGGPAYERLVLWTLCYGW